MAVGAEQERRINDDFLVLNLITGWMRELFTKMMVRTRLGVHFGMEEINGSRRLGFLVVKSIILEGLSFWI